MQGPVKGAALKCHQGLHLIDEDYTSKLCSCCKKAATADIMREDKRAIHTIRCYLTANYSRMVWHRDDVNAARL